MKALSLWQPWATLMADGYKRIETRSWSTRYRGRLAICAAKKDTKEGRDLWADEQSDEAIPRYLGTFDGLPLGKLLCIVDLVDVVPTQWLLGSHEDLASRYRTEYFSRNGNPTGEERYGNYAVGRFAWITSGRRQLRPIPVVGHQGLFGLDLDEWPYGPPDHHEVVCTLFRGSLECDCAASDASDTEFGLQS